VIRAEYLTETGATSFEDGVTQVFLFRGRQSPTPFTVDNATDWCNITTSELVLSFFKPSAPTSAQQCTASTYAGFDATCESLNEGACSRARGHPDPVTSASVDECCAICTPDPECGAFVYHSDAPSANCFLLAPNTTVGRHATKAAITLGSKVPVDPKPSPPPGPPAPHGPAAFAKHLLQARSIQPGGWSWHASDSAVADGNLFGTLFPTPSADLAGCCSNPNATAGHYDPKYPLDKGLISTAGWALVDDSASPLMEWDAQSQHIEDAWISSAPRTGNSDYYLFGCGTAYKQCLADFTAIAGPIAFPPVYGVGVWWSRHWGDESGNKKYAPVIRLLR
jgi:hypothetical protein